MTARDRHFFNDIISKAELREIFSEIRNDVKKAGSRLELTKLYWLASYLIQLTETQSAKTLSDKELNGIRTTAEEEFFRTARQINHRAGQVGTDANYSEKWND